MWVGPRWIIMPLCGPILQAELSTFFSKAKNSKIGPSSAKVRKLYHMEDKLKWKVTSTKRQPQLNQYKNGRWAQTENKHNCFALCPFLPILNTKWKLASSRKQQVALYPSASSLVFYESGTRSYGYPDGFRYMQILCRAIYIHRVISPAIFKSLLKISFVISHDFWRKLWFPTLRFFSIWISNP